MSKIFGANWQTSLWGLITLVATAIAFKPDLIAFLPPDVQKWVSGICGLIAFISGGAFALKTKDKNVTGGTVQQTVSGAPAKEGTQTLVDRTVQASFLSGESLTPEQMKAFHDSAPIPPPTPPKQ